MDPYIIRKAVMPVDISAPWESECWHNAYTLKLQHIFRESSSHRPPTKVKVQYDDQFIYGLFQVEDYFVAARHQVNQEQVCEDSCVEFFVRPANAKKYFNFEMNCIGTILLYHILDCRAELFDRVPEEDLATIKRFHTIQGPVLEEEVGKQTWRLGFQIPIELFVKYFNVDPVLSGQVWHGNFCKCGEETSHPHWITWVPFSKLDFHLPDEFGTLIFE